MQFTVVDATVFGVMLAASVFIGVYNGVRSSGRSTQEYMLGGRKMSPIPVAFSLLGGAASAITIIGNPTEAYYFGTQISICALGAIIACVFITQFTLPILYKLRIVSLNEYLELRYQSRPLKLLVTCATLLNSIVLMGLFLYAPSLALSTVTNLSSTTSIVVMGLVCTFYVTVGGVKAVVYTDVLQTLVMLGGVLTVTVICCVDLGGVANVWTIADHGHRLQFFNFDTNPFVRHTFWSTLCMGMYMTLFAVGFSQHAFQRLISVDSLPTAQKISYTFNTFMMLYFLVLYFCGLVAYATYRTCDPLTSGMIEKADQILPYLVTNRLSHLPGLSGLFVAAVYGGVLSSVSSLGNSAACLVWEDCLKHRPYFSRLSDRSATNVNKFITCLVGVLALVVGTLVGSLGNILSVMITLMGTIGGPQIGLFLAGMFIPWVNAKGAVVGFSGTLICSLWLVVGKFLRGGSPVALPLSVHGCPHLALNDTTALNNTTALILVSNLLNTTFATSLTSDATLATPAAPNQFDDTTIYDLSYCYVGMLGILMTMIVSAIVSLCTGPTDPKLLTGLVNPTCGRLYRCVWRRVSGHRKAAVKETGGGTHKCGKILMEKQAALPLSHLHHLQH